MKSLCNWSKVEQHYIDKYLHIISADLPSLPPDLACCCEPDCTRHTKILDSYGVQPRLSNALLRLLPCPYLIIQGHLGAVLQVGTMALNRLRNKLIFGTRFKCRLSFKWCIATGKLSLGVNIICCKGYQMEARSHQECRVFWSRVRQISNSKISKGAIFCFDGDDNIAELWVSKLKCLYSSCSGDLSLTVHSKISSTSLSELSVSDLDVCEAL